MINILTKLFYEGVYILQEIVCDIMTVMGTKHVETIASFVPLIDNATETNAQSSLHDSQKLVWFYNQTSLTRAAFDEYIQDITNATNNPQQRCMTLQMKAGFDQQSMLDIGLLG